MKKTFSLRLLCAVGLCLVSLSALGAPDPSAVEASKHSFSLGQLEVEAQKLYSGDGIMMAPTAEGARLKAAFQKLEGSATAAGLWLRSSEDLKMPDRFQVRAAEFGRGGDSAGVVLLPDHGEVGMADESVMFVRPGLTEEYRVSMDGVRQDFVVNERPAGAGELSVTLNVAGARVEAAAYGAKLTLNGSGREIAYSRLQVTDAAGKALDAHFVIAGSSRMQIRVEDAGAVYPVRIDPTFSDADWLGMEGSPGTNGIVYASAVDGSGNLYIGGSFTQLGATPVNYIGKWDGSAWTTLGSGFNNEVRVLLYSGSTLYAGGYFTTAGGNPALRLAKWDGSAWSAVGTGMNGAVLALAVNGADLYAGGDFTTAGGVDANYIAKWNGSSWAALGTANVGGGTSGSVRGIGINGSDVYAGGAFFGAGGVQVNNIARWNGTTWNPLGVAGNNAGVTYTVNCVLVTGGSTYVGGGFNSAGGTVVNCIARWNGSAWVGLGAGVNGAVSAMAVSGTDIYVGGIFTTVNGILNSPGVAKWNTGSSTWTAPSAGVTGATFALSVAGSTVYAGGDFLKSGTQTVNRVAKWDGSTWSPVRPAGINNDVYAVAISGANVFVGGAFTTAAGINVSRIARWDGSNWNAMGTGMDQDVKALLVSGSDLYAGGSFTTAGGGSASGIAKWNGTSWSALGTGIPGTVQALAISGSNLYAGGNFATAGGGSATNIARWDGSSWNSVGTGVDGTVNALAISGANVYAGGTFTSAGGSPANYVARWNGTAWGALGAGTSEPVNALLVSGANVYAGGMFVSAGGITVNHIAKWGGTSWTALGTGIDGRVNALAMSGSYVYAGGLFANAGGAGASSIARWNGKVWSPLGSGANNSVNALAVSSSQLYVGGGYTSAGGKSISRIAQAALPPEPEISVLGNGVEIVSGDVTPSTADFTDFGPVNINGGTVTRSFTVSNTAAVSSLTLGGSPVVAIGGDNAADFTVSIQPSSPIPPQVGVPLTITFDPSATGVRTAIVSIQTDDPDEDPYTFMIQGTGGIPEIAVFGNNVEIASQSFPPTTANHTDFGFVFSNSATLTRTFTITNTGTAPLSATSSPMVSVTGGVGGNFTVQSQPSSPIAIGGSATFTVTFAPTTLGQQSAVISINNDDADEGAYALNIKGTGEVPGSITLSDAVYRVYQGDPSVQVTLNRTGGMLKTAVKINTDNGTASALPPYAAGTAGADYVDLVGDATTANFDDNQTTKTITIALPLKTANVPNRRFRVSLTAISGQAALGAIPNATVEILAADSTGPTVTIKTPAAGPVNALSPYTVTGVVGDPKGVVSVMVKLNGDPEMAALLGAATSATAVPYSLDIAPQDGANTLTVVATDMRGNATTLTRDFNFTRRYVMTLARSAPSATPDMAGTVAMAATPAAGASALAPATANSNPRTANIGTGTAVKLTATTKAGYTFSHWTGLPGTPTVTGDIATFVMPANPCTITAHWVANPFAAPPGTGNVFYGLIHADTGTTPANSTEGFLTATMSPTGGLTGKLFMNGATQSFTAAVYGNGSTTFTVSGAKKNFLTTGAQQLTLTYNVGLGNNQLAIEVTGGGGDVSKGIAKRNIHTTANKVDSALLNPGTTKGFYTVAFPSKAQPGLTPPPDTDFPQGAGFGTINLTATGDTTFAVTLADGSVFTAASALVEGEVSPLFGQLVTPGAAATMKGGCFGGTMVFAPQPASDVTGTDFIWIRPGVTAVTSPPLAAAATNLYTDGWPSGVYVDAFGALYNTALSVQFTLGLPPANLTLGNAELLFTDGKLVSDISYQAFNIDFNTVTTIPAKDPRYSLVVTPKTGLFSGTFTPDWDHPNTALPTFKGMLIQKGASKGGYGYFLNNALSESAPESGKVILRKRVVVGP